MGDRFANISNFDFLGSGLNVILLLSLCFEQRRMEKCHPQIILDLELNHKISHLYRSEKIIVPE